MSIETQPHPSPETAAVGPQSEAELLQEVIGDTVENITEWQVPASYEAAKEKVKELRNFERSVDARIAGEPAFGDELDKDMLAELHEVTRLGVKNWSLTKETTQEWVRVLGARRVMGSKGLSDEMRNRLQRFAAHNGLVGEAEQLLAFKRHAKARLDLNVEIMQNKRAEQKQRDQGVTAQTEQVKTVSDTADASKLAVAPESPTPAESASDQSAASESQAQADSEDSTVPASEDLNGNGRQKTRRATRAATSLPIDGTASETTGPDDVTPTDTPDAHDAHTFDADTEGSHQERPPYVDPDIWDTYDDTQKRIVSDPRSDVARRAASITRPVQIPVEAWEDRPLYEQIRLADYYEGFTASGSRSESKPRYFRFWNEEQEAAIEYLKKPLPKPRHNMDSWRGRRNYAAENGTPASEHIGRATRYLGREALKALTTAGTTSEAILAKAAPVAKKSLRTTVRGAIVATKKGMEADEQMIRGSMAIERGIGRLMLAAAERTKLKQKGKHTGAYVAKRLKQIDEWLEEE